MTLRALNTKLKAAEKGHDLLKKKADALNMRFRAILIQYRQKKEEMGKLMRAASICLTETKFIMGKETQVILQGVKQASFCVRLTTENVVGVYLPVFEPVHDSNAQAADKTGLSKGGFKVKESRKLYLIALNNIVKVAVPSDYIHDT